MEWVRNKKNNNHELYLLSINYTHNNTFSKFLRIHSYEKFAQSLHNCLSQLFSVRNFQPRALMRSEHVYLISYRTILNPHLDCKNDVKNSLWEERKKSKCFLRVSRGFPDKRRVTIFDQYVNLNVKNLICLMLIHLFFLYSAKWYFKKTLTQSHDDAQLNVLKNFKMTVIQM